MSRVRSNLVANLGSSVWLTLLSVAVFPLYIKYLGIEAYGLIGAFTAFQSFTALIDAGLRTVGAVGVLMFVSPTLDAFFVWQITINAVQTAALGWLLWRGLPPGDRRARFSMDGMLAVRRFAAGVVGVTLLGLMLQQVDKL